LNPSRRRTNHSTGSFEWGGCEFKESASDIHLDREGDEELPILRATLNNVDGEEVEADINLAERISNDNGNLVFV
jgi:CVNH domain.